MKNPDNDTRARRFMTPYVIGAQLAHDHAGERRIGTKAEFVRVTGCSSSIAWEVYRQNTKQIEGKVQS